MPHPGSEATTKLSALQWRKVPQMKCSQTQCCWPAISAHHNTYNNQFLHASAALALLVCAMHMHPALSARRSRPSAVKPLGCGHNAVHFPVATL